MTKHEEIKAPDLAGALHHAANEKRLEVDVERYEAYLDDPSLSQEQKAEFIEALWTIVTAFVELGFGVHPVQQACGQIENGTDPAETAGSDVVTSKHTELSETFNDGPDQT